MRSLALLIAACSAIASIRTTTTTTAFAPSPTTTRRYNYNPAGPATTTLSTTTQLSAHVKTTAAASSSSPQRRALVIGSLLASSVWMFIATAQPAFCYNEIGVEKVAPTLYTGETVEICTKRGPLGACLKTEMRTETNDNDIAKKYFRDPSELIRQREASLRDNEEGGGNLLIEKLRQQSIDNAERNDLIVQRKTFEADQSATFGPFDKQVLIMNTDGKTFTLLENPVAMRLKKAGFIDNKRSFITQPTPEDIEKASESEGGFLGGLFGGD